MVFHTVLTAFADEYVGCTLRDTQVYGLVYRSVDHAKIDQLCRRVAEPGMAEKLRKFVPDEGFGTNLNQFAALDIQLREKRHFTDYDPTIWFNIADAGQVIQSPRSAIGHFGSVDAEQKNLFLLLLFFSPR